MVKIKHSEKRLIDGWFDMSGGNVLDFSNQTLSEFFEDELSINIYSDKYAENGNSKANRVRTFLSSATPRRACRLLRALWKYRNRAHDEVFERKNALFSGGYIDVEELELHEMPMALENEEFEKTVSAIEARSEDEVINAATIVAQQFSFDTVMDEIERARSFIDDDPEDAITAASSLLESVCRSILVELSLPLPKDLAISSLYKAVRDPLGLSPDKPEMNPVIADDVRKILSGISNAVSGIGALRTHAGDAHGRERGVKRVDARIARLSVNAASSLALFLIESWAAKYPERGLPNSNKA
ncbi:abortive infection family protein [Roseovarius aestuariivivens]|uniref:abortive infection family protein n=1 Tax=Roseovarius aestuariivivens TaxID=1888910 RepID=UPI001AEBAE6A|nr:abortive infection family protein [Roseovarius aestuariivivens]